jgi:hypothetical protein
MNGSYDRKRAPRWCANGVLELEDEIPDCERKPCWLRVEIPPS